MATELYDRADEVVVADGNDHVAALVAAHLAARIGAPLLLGGSAPLPATTTAIQTLSPTTLFVVGDVDPDTLPRDEGRRVIQVTGDSAAALAAAAVRTRPGTPDLPILLVTQDTFADALAGANLAPALLLMTAPDTLSTQARTVLRDFPDREVTMLGGVAAMGEEVEQQVAELGNGVTRVAGDSRYDTALAATSGRRRVVIASGQSFADAVAMVPWSAANDADLVLSTHHELPGQVLADLEAHHDQAVIVGGTKAVGNFVDVQAQAALTGAPPAGFASAVRALTDEDRDAMTEVTWRPGCPVGLEELRIVQMRYWQFDGNVVDDGQMVVAATVADQVVGVMARLFDARFPLGQVTPIHAFAGDDHASMDANNSSAFNCRYVGGTTTWSQHSYGTAIDLNPVQNPYVRGSTVEPQSGEEYLDREDVRPGMITRPGPVTAAFADIGWGWGADFTNSDDYQHFSQTGR